MKKLFSYVFSAFALPLVMFFLSLPAMAQSASSSALAYLPENTTLFMSVDMKRMWTLPVFVQLKNATPELTAELTEFEANIKKISIKPEDVAVSALVFIGDVEKQEGGIIINTKLTESKFEEILSGKVFGEAFKYETLTINNKKVFIVKDSAEGGKDMAFSFLAKDYIIAMEPAKIINYLPAKKGLPSDMAKKASSIDSKSLVWGFLTVPARAKVQEQEKGMDSVSFTDNIKNADFSMNVSGPNSSDLSIKLSLYCADKQAVKDTVAQCTQTMAFLPLMVPGIKPELANQLVTAVKINGVNDAVKIDINLKEATIKQLIELKDSIMNPEMPQTGALVIPAE